MLPFNNDIEPCLEKLHAGGLILYPTDTVWGIGCDATNTEAVARIYRLKKRSDVKAMIVLVADEKDILAEDGSVAIRICDDEFCKNLIKRFRKPLVSTSANISGYPPPQCFKDIDAVIVDGVDYVVNYRQEDTEQRKPSSIIKWEKDGTLSIIRP